MKYKMLVISNNEKINTSLKSLFKEDYEIIIAESLNQGQRLIAQRQLDFLIINSPLPDGSGYNIAMDNGNRIPTIILVGQMNYEDVYYKLSNYGVITISKPARKDLVIQAVRMLETARGVSSKKPSNKSLAERLMESKRINLAKMLLMADEHITEDEAHKYIVNKAMNLRLSKLEIAEKIIKKYHKGV